MQQHDFIEYMKSKSVVNSKKKLIDGIYNKNKRKPNQRPVKCKKAGAKIGINQRGNFGKTKEFSHGGKSLQMPSINKKRNYK